MRFLADMVSQVRNEEEKIREGGGAKAIENQHGKGRLTARERINLLADPGTFFELGSFAAYGMYEEWGGAPAAGVVTGLARIHTRLVMIIANDATVKAGAFFPMTSKKVIRAQNIAIENRIPTIYLVDSAGVFLPLQEDVFPDTDDFGRVFRNNAVMSAMGIPQIAAIMGMCVAGGGYLPVMCDHVLMTEGSGLFLAGPALVQAAIGQKVSAEELGGAAMHSAISGTVDFREPNDEACIARIRSIIEKWGYRRQSPWDRKKPARSGAGCGRNLRHLRLLARAPLRHEGNHCARGRWQPLRRIQSRVWQDADLRLCAASAASLSGSSPIRNCMRSRPIMKATSAWNSAASSTPSPPRRPRASSWIAIRI